MSINLYQRDCLEAMKEMPDNSYELAIVDPPYGIDVTNQKQGEGGGVAKKIQYTKKDWDKCAPDADYFKELKRISKNQIIWGANHFISKTPFNSSCWIVWDKDNGATDFADCELAWTSFKTAVRKIKWKWAGMLQQDMKNKEVRIHPTQKPVRLYEWILDNYAKEGDKILDTHLGSGSIALACHNRGYSLDAYEIDEEYLNAAADRLRIHQSQLTIF
tara:strand:+ start:64 stop:714 length:651 start_codon:yes stop_codon:yes gene_type:complete